MLSWIKYLNAFHHKTIVITSHSMSDLEKLGVRVVLIHNGLIRFDGGFAELRATVPDRRILTVETDIGSAPAVRGAEVSGSVGGRHEYLFDANRVSVVDLLRELSETCRISDIQTTPAAIDDVVSEVYRRMSDTADPDEEAGGSV